VSRAREFVGLCFACAALVLMPAGVVCFYWSIGWGWPPPLFGYVTAAVTVVAVLLYGFSVWPILTEHDDLRARIHGADRAGEA
jgi:hypothetical protein